MSIQQSQTGNRTNIKRVLITGGVHGNELTGIYLIRKLQKTPELAQRSSFETTTLLANPKAIAATCRFTETDLNRCFRLHDLQDWSRSTYEDLQAKLIWQRFGPQGQTPTDVVIDLHTSTANMGLTLITTPHPFNLRLAAHLQQQYPQLYIYTIPASPQSSGLASIAIYRYTLELGAIAQGILQTELFQKMEALLYAILDYLEAYNHGHEPVVPDTILTYQHQGTMDYPRSPTGDLLAMIHPHRQFQDYQPLHPGDPLFFDFDAQEISYQGPSITHPVFINEAAYYEKGIALCLTDQITIDLNDL